MNAANGNPLQIAVKRLRVMSRTQKTRLPKTKELISVSHPRIWRNCRPSPLKTVCHTKPLWPVYYIASPRVDSWKYQAEPESPAYLAFRSEPDFQRSSKKMNRRNTGYLIAAFPSGFLTLAYCLLMLCKVFAIITGMDSTAEHGGWLWWTAVVAFCLTIAQWPFYLLWVAISKELSFRQKVGWCVVIFLLNMFAMPYFLWCKFRQTTVSGLLAIIGRQRIRDYLK